MSGARSSQSALAGVFGAAEAILWIGEKRFAPARATYARTLNELPSQRETYQAIGWVTRGELRAGLPTLRRLLAPGGVIVLARDEPVLSALSRALRLMPKDDGAWLTEACEALLLSGLEAPRVLSGARPRLALVATKPKQLGALDEFFEQPRS